jgi:hypothetical protein
MDVHEPVDIGSLEEEARADRWNFPLRGASQVESRQLGILARGDDERIVMRGSVRTVAVEGSDRTHVVSVKSAPSFADRVRAANGAWSCRDFRAEQG